MTCPRQSLDELGVYPFVIFHSAVFCFSTFPTFKLIMQIKYLYSDQFSFPSSANWFISLSQSKTNKLKKRFQELWIHYWFSAFCHRMSFKKIHNLWKLSCKTAWLSDLVFAELLAITKQGRLKMYERKI